uniref:glycine zipper domain-containing protein n=1 Tax=Prevotella sp. TaxID=59823 RepID=UPI004027796B
MGKSFIIGMSALLLLGSCDTYTGTGAYMGSTLGSIFGSAIGGIAGGPHGSDVGTIVGMVGGAVAGAAIGQATDQKQQAQREADIADMRARRAERQARRQGSYGNDNTYGHGNNYGYDNQGSDYSGSGFDANNGGDDRIYDFKGSDYSGNYSAKQPDVNMPMQSSVDNLAENLKYTPDIEIKNARFVDDNQDGKIERGELSKVIFEVYNRGNHTLYDVVPTVVEATGNRHIMISPNMHVESIQPGKGIRYTALVKADNRLKDGNAQFCVSVVQGNKKISKVCEFDIPTVR